MGFVRSGLPAGAAVVSSDQREYWDAAAAGDLMLPRCDRCQTVIWYPRHHCPVCGSGHTTWFKASGKGRVYTYTVVHQGQGEFAGATPYVIAYVELAEGPRVLTNLLGAADGWSIGQAVRAVFDQGEGDAPPVLRFEAETG